MPADVFSAYFFENECPGKSDGNACIRTWAHCHRAWFLCKQTILPRVKTIPEYFYLVGELHGVTKKLFVEPLVGHMRHPYGLEECSSPESRVDVSTLPATSGANLNVCHIHRTFITSAKYVANYAGNGPFLPDGESVAHIRLPAIIPWQTVCQFTPLNRHSRIILRIGSCPESWKLPWASLPTKFGSHLRLLASDVISRDVHIRQCKWGIDFQFTIREFHCLCARYLFDCGASTFGTSLQYLTTRYRQVTWPPLLMNIFQFTYVLKSL